MNIDHFVVHIRNKSGHAPQDVILEVDLYLSPIICLHGFKLAKDGLGNLSWTIPQYYSYLLPVAITKSILNDEGKKFIVEQLTKAITSVKLVLTKESYGKSYLVNSEGATLMAQ